MATHFSLRPVVRLRRTQERRERLKLEAISSEMAQARARLDQMTSMSSAWSRQAQDSLGAGALGSQLRWDAQRTANLAVARAAQAARLATLEQLRQDQLHAYMQARQQRELVESLLRRKLEFYRLTQSRREQQQLDDLFLMRQAILHDE